jgi:predicted MPP superfamily phosphohydrolase
MEPILEPRDGDIEDDAASTKRRSLLQLAGNMLAEISLPKLLVVWLLLIGFPGLLLGSTPLLASIWIRTLLPKALAIFAGVWSAVAVLLLIGLGWLGGRGLLRLAESSFWSLNALAVQPSYVLFRESFRHLAEKLFVRGVDNDARAKARALAAITSGVTICGLALGVIALFWPATRWIGSMADLAAPISLLPTIIANAIVVISAYLATAALAWSIADATMAPVVDYTGFANAEPRQRVWRVAHLSDLHVVGERYGFRIESGRSGPRGNERVISALDALAAVDAAEPLDMILVTGDMTDAGRSTEWAELMSILAAYPRLANRIIAVPGNHDVNVVDRANPARMEWPLSRTKRLRRLRTLSALEALQGSRLHVVEQQSGRIGATLTDTLRPHAVAMASYADTGSPGLRRALSHLWPSVFPLVMPPESDDGLGVIALDSNAETHFSFTNALGLVTVGQMRAIGTVVRQYPRAHWIVALHHHVIEYPQVDTPFFERIGTALINGTLFIRTLRGLTDRAIIMHGHRHIDWIGQCSGLPIISASSVVMEEDSDQDPYFYIHTIAAGTDGQVRLLPPRRIHTGSPISKAQ